MEKEKLFEIIQSLLKKYSEANVKVVFEAEFIEEILFIKNEDQTKTINNEIFYMLRSNSVDMKGVSFKNVHIKKHSFNGLKNVEINIDEIPNRDISETYLKDVKITGSLDDAYIRQTDFEGYIGDLVLNPQKIKDKDFYCTNLAGIAIDGSFDGTFISSTSFKGAKGKIMLNPQKVIDKNLVFSKLAGVELIGDYNFETHSYDNACFDGCYICGTDFNGCIGRIEINPQTVKLKTMALCKGSGITFLDTLDGIITDGCDLKDCKYAEIIETQVQQSSKALSLFYNPRIK